MPKLNRTTPRPTATPTHTATASSPPLRYRMSWFTWSVVCVSSSVPFTYSCTMHARTSTASRTTAVWPGPWGSDCVVDGATAGPCNACRGGATASTGQPSVQEACPVGAAPTVLGGSWGSGGAAIAALPRDIEAPTTAPANCPTMRLWWRIGLCIAVEGRACATAATGGYGVSARPADKGALGAWGRPTTDAKRVQACVLVVHIHTTITNRAAIQTCCLETRRRMDRKRHRSPWCWSA
mmetsp:Transcript_57997/g.103576  ORF Transcript_57997/g.103576 Transcript_57997/m.103576 type:complete len:238 (+) Transcript_57997:909-1622(+)